MHIVMVAAENGALAGAKVGGIGDVVRDVPLALARRGHTVTVITPGYQALSKLPGATFQQNLLVNFSGNAETLSLHSIAQPDSPPSVQYLVLEHPLFAACGAGKIYCHDEYEPFATDASKFALFCHAVCAALATQAIAKTDVIHLHDWHAALVLLLREYSADYLALQDIPTVFSIHNLSLQGVRPFADNWSSPDSWFPDLAYPLDAVQDPINDDCINLMRVGINLADQVHAVSPHYAKEILLPSHHELGLVRGENLEADLLKVSGEGRLHGILNGCEYSDVKLKQKKPSKARFVASANAELRNWADKSPYINSALFFAQLRLQEWVKHKNRDQSIVASIGRLTSQKVSLLQVKLNENYYAIDALLDALDTGFMVMLGSGDEGCEHFMADVMKRHSNFLFLCGYSEALGELLYEFCDLFLMPSSFEPCGISQMLAMRAGRPCLVHKVGGLADTVLHMFNGFCFDGEDELAQVQNMLIVFSEALVLQQGKTPAWQDICKNAAGVRFSWDESVSQYESYLYKNGQ
ncbi:MAG: glycogen/starch synthase [Pseudomonadota bacterium]